MRPTRRWRCRRTPERRADPRDQGTRRPDPLGAPPGHLRPPARRCSTTSASASAIRWYADRHLAPVGIAVRCEIEGLDARLPAGRGDGGLPRRSRRPCTNVLRHAGATSVLIQMARTGGTLSIEIEDDGKGFEPEAVATPESSGRGLGLLGIRERVELLGGSVDDRLDAGRGDAGRRDRAAPRGSREVAKIRIVIADDHALLREGIRAILSKSRTRGGRRGGGRPGGGRALQGAPPRHRPDGHRDARGSAGSRRRSRSGATARA